MSASVEVVSGNAIAPAAFAAIFIAGARFTIICRFFWLIFVFPSVPPPPPLRKSICSGGPAFDVVQMISSAAIRNNACTIRLIVSDPPPTFRQYAMNGPSGFRGASSTPSSPSSPGFTGTFAVCFAGTGGGGGGGATGIGGGGVNGRGVIGKGSPDGPDPEAGELEFMSRTGKGLLCLPDANSHDAARTRFPGNSRGNIKAPPIPKTSRSQCPQTASRSSHLPPAPTGSQAQH